MPLRDDLLNPIPGSNPSGENLRYAPIYDQIKEARREEEEIAQGDWQRERKKADWVLVMKLCQEALAKKSKDLQIAAWLTEAALRREGYSGLKSGLDLLHGLVENFWDTLYPELEDGEAEFRATPLDWVGSRLDQPLKSVALTRGGLDWLKYKESRSVPYEDDSGRAEARAQAVEEGKLTPEGFDAGVDETPKDFYAQRRDQLDGCLESLEALNQLCEDKFGEFAPSLGGLRKSLEEVRQTVHMLLAKKREREPDAEVEAEPEADAEAVEEYAREPVYTPSMAAAAPARARARKPLGPEPADSEDAHERVLSAARYLRQNEPYSPVPFLLVRALRWGELRAAGEPDPALLEAPATEVRQELKRLAYDGSWQEVLEAAENAMGTPCGRGWLDLQRYTVRACQELGYEAIAAAIGSELRALLTDMPQLLELSLLDDTPTANAETRAWLEESVITAAQGQREDFLSAAPEPHEEAGEQLGTETVDAFELAVQAARSGRAEDGIEILTREIAQEPSGRGRFQRKVQLAQICLSGGHGSIAYPILENLAEEIERRRLEEWEPAEKVAHPLALLFRCMSDMEVSAEEKQKIYGRICRLDPVQALALPK